MRSKKSKKSSGNKSRKSYKRIKSNSVSKKTKKNKNLNKLSRNKFKISKKRSKKTKKNKKNLKNIIGGGDNLEQLFEKHQKKIFNELPFMGEKDFKEQLNTPDKIENFIKLIDKGETSKVALYDVTTYTQDKIGNFLSYYDNKDYSSLIIFLKKYIHNKGILEKFTENMFFKDVYSKVYIEKITEKRDKIFKLYYKEPPTLSYLSDPFYSEDKNPEFYYEWWMGKIEQYGKKTSEWIIYDEFKYYTINLFTSIINSYLIYKDNEKFAAKELEILIGNFNIFRIFKQYNLFWNLYKSYIEWYKIRVGDDDLYKCDVAIRKLSDNFLYKDYICILPLSFVPSQKKFLKLMAAPLYPLIGRHKKAHGRFTHPCWHIRHDLFMHLQQFKYKGDDKDIIEYYKNQSKFFAEFFNKYNNNDRYIEYLFALCHEYNDFIRKITKNIIQKINYLNFIKEIRNKNLLEKINVTSGIFEGKDNININIVEDFISIEYQNTNVEEISKFFKDINEIITTNKLILKL